MAEFQLMYDLRWVAQAKQGDQQAFTRLYNASYNAVYHLVCPMCKSSDEVDDIIQDSYIQCYQNLYRLQDDTRFIPWMKAIARNKALDYLKKKRDVLFSELESDDPDAPELEFADDRNTFVPDIQTDKMETARLLGQIMQSLPEKQKICITMFYIDNMHIEEIARMLGTSEGSVKQALMHGRKSIKEKVLALEKQGTKLYGLAPLPFFYLLVKSWLGTQFIPNAGICQAVLAISGGATAAGAAGAAVGAGSAVEAAGAGAGTFAAGAGTTAAAAAGTGAAAAGAAGVGAAGMTGAATVGGIAAAGTIIGGKLAVKAAIIVGAVILGGGGITAGAIGITHAVEEHREAAQIEISSEEEEESVLDEIEEEAVIEEEHEESLVDEAAEASLEDPENSVFEESVESSTPSEESAPQDPNNPFIEAGPYQNLLENYQEYVLAIKEDNNAARDLYGAEGFNTLMALPYFPDYYWGLLDVNGDGIEELLIGSTLSTGTYYFALHTLANGVPSANLFPSIGERTNLSIYDNGRLVQRGSDGAQANRFTAYELAKGTGELIFIDGCREDWGKYYKVDKDSNSTEISETEYRNYNISGGGNEIFPSWHLFSSTKVNAAPMETSQETSQETNQEQEIQIPAGMTVYRSTLYEYDAKGQRIHSTIEMPQYSSTEENQWTYNEAGQVQTWVKSSGSFNEIVTYVYDEIGRLIQSTKTIEGTDHVEETLYDSHGNPYCLTMGPETNLTINYYDGVIDPLIIYPETYRLSKEQKFVGGKLSESIEYSALDGSRLLRYNESGDMTYSKIEGNYRTGGDVPPGEEFWEYEYDALGNKTSMKHTENWGDRITVHEYVYDNIYDNSNHLIYAALKDKATGRVISCTTWEYNDQGSLIQEIEYVKDR